MIHSLGKTKHAFWKVSNCTIWIDHCWQLVQIKTFVNCTVLSGRFGCTASVFISVKIRYFDMLLFDWFRWWNCLEFRRFDSGDISTRGANLSSRCITFLNQQPLLAWNFEKTMWGEFHFPAYSNLPLTAVLAVHFLGSISAKPWNGDRWNTQIELTLLVRKYLNHCRIWHSLKSKGKTRILIFTNSSLPFRASTFSFNFQKFALRNVNFRCCERSKNRTKVLGKFSWVVCTFKNQHGIKQWAENRKGFKSSTSLDPPLT